MNNPKRPVIAIGLDSAEPSLIERWMSQGYLPHLSHLRKQGIYGRLENFDDSNVETAWTTFATGCPPKKTGFWVHLGLKEGSYTTETRAAYDYQEYPPFYALGKGYRIAAFDVPQVRLSDQIEGIQVGGWGAHSPQVESQSQPFSLLAELIEKHGASPSLHQDYAICLDLKKILSLEEPLKANTALRSAICQDLLTREPWDLFLTVFNDPHSAGHIFWHLSQSDHPLYETFQSQISHDPLLAIYQEMDKAIGEIVSKVPENAYVMIFSAHGMGSATIDLPSFVYLPELMYRFSFPGQQKLATSLSVDPLAPPLTEMEWNYWERHIWGSQQDSNPITRFLRQKTPTRLFRLIEPYLEKNQSDPLISPWELRRRGDNVIPWNPAEWYKPLWAKMKAFALPSFAEGYIRINLQGREPQGMVSADDYHALCDQLCEMLYALKDARTGIPMVRKIVRTRKDPRDSHPKLPDPDLIVVWQDDYATDVIESPDYGRLGPLPPYRAGSHRHEGFLLACGEGIEPNSRLSSGHALDLAPTILSLMNAPIPDYLEGKPLLKIPVENA